MRITDAIKLAVCGDNAALAGRCADTLRARGMTYAEIFDFARQQVPDLTESQWEQLMYEADEGDQ